MITPGFVRTAPRKSSLVPLALGCTLLGGCLAVTESRYTFHANGTGEAQYVTRFNEEMALATETGPCQWSLINEKDARVEIVEDNVRDNTRRGEWLRCTYRLGPIPSEELLQRALDERGYGQIRRSWFSSTLELDALDSKKVLERYGYCEGKPCPGSELTYMQFSMLADLAHPSEGSTTEAVRTEFDDLLARFYYCKLELAGDGVGSVEGLALDESEGVYRYTTDCRKYLGTAFKWTVDR